MLYNMHLSAFNYYTSHLMSFPKPLIFWSESVIFEILAKYIIQNDRMNGMTRTVCAKLESYYRRFPNERATATRKRIMM